MSQSVVIGLGFGDEGKGLVTDWLCRQKESPVVVRYSGGHQVGHCVRTETEKHVFSNFGSGTLAGAPTIWNAKTIDPVGFCNEYEDIKEFNPKIIINPKCPVTTPWDKMANIFNNSKTNHSTIGVGFGTTIEREEKHYHLYFGDLFYPEIFKHKLDMITQYYTTNYNVIKYVELKEFLDACEKIITLVETHTISGKNYIYESSQGLMLDMEYGFFPYVTRSRLGTQELNVTFNTEYYLVTRGYQTRHGNGPCEKSEYTPNNIDETNHNNDFQGEFKTRVLDLDTLLYAIKIDDNIRESRKKNLVITCLDQMETYPYIYKGEVYEARTEEYFLKCIWHIIQKESNFLNMYTSHGPTAKDITLYEESC